MKLLLTSAGITNKSIADSLASLTGKRLSETRAAFILTAKNNRDISAPQAMERQIAQLDKWNIPYTLADPSFDSDWRKTLDNADLVVIGGGNTFHLLNEARKTGFDTWLKDNIDQKVIMGTSAGSILQTPHVGVAAVDGGDENIVGITDLAGLGFVDFEISPHTPEDVSIEGNLNYSRTASHQLLMLDNNSAIQVTDSGTKIISEGQWHWCNDGKLTDSSK